MSFAKDEFLLDTLYTNGVKKLNKEFDVIRFLKKVR